MTLQDYLKEAYPDMAPSAADEAFAKKIGTSRQSINRYRVSGNFPAPEIIARIRDATRGLVTAEDLLPEQYRARSQQKRKSRV
jgi:DNA-binding transcriptional regulator YdaS (Cro superfamily)